MNAWSSGCAGIAKRTAALATIGMSSVFTFPFSAELESDVPVTLGLRWNDPLRVRSRAVVRAPRHRERTTESSVGVDDGPCPTLAGRGVIPHDALKVRRHGARAVLLKVVIGVPDDLVEVGRVAVRLRYRGEGDGSCCGHPCDH